MEERRGYSFVDLAVVIDPTEEEVLVWLSPWVGSPPDQPLGRTSPGVDPVSFRRILVRDSDLPILRTNKVHLYGNGGCLADCDLIFAYTTHGTLSAMLSKVEDGSWAVSQLPEELNGTPTLLPSVRFLFGDEPTAREVFELAVRLGTYHRLGAVYPGVDADANRFFALMMASPDEPRMVLVANPPRTLDRFDLPT